MMDRFLTSLGFTKSKTDSNLYYKVEKGNPVILVLYVDDLFVTGEDGLITDAKSMLIYESKIFTKNKADSNLYYKVPPKGI